MTEEQRAELEKLARAATQGEWTFRPEDGRVRGDMHVVVWETPLDQDAAFIAAANPATVLDLLATIARLEAEAVKDGEALEKISEGGPDIGPVIKQTYMHGFDQGCAWAGRVARAHLSSRAKDQSQ